MIERTLSIGVRVFPAVTRILISASTQLRNSIRHSRTASLIRQTEAGARARPTKTAPAQPGLFSNLSYLGRPGAMCHLGKTAIEPVSQMKIRFPVRLS